MTLETSIGYGYDVSGRLATISAQGLPHLSGKSQPFGGFADGENYCKPTSSRKATGGGGYIAGVVEGYPGTLNSAFPTENPTCQIPGSDKVLGFGLNLAQGEIATLKLPKSSIKGWKTKKYRYMKKLFTAIAALTIIQTVAIALLLLRARRQDERIVAAASTIIAQLQYAETLRDLYYGKGMNDAMVPSMIDEVNAVHENSHPTATWYTWIRAYGYGSKRKDNTPEYPPGSLLYFDLLALPNYPEWVDDANFARDSSRYAFRLFFDEYVASSKYAGHLKFIEELPRRNFGKAAKFNLPETD